MDKSQQSKLYTGQEQECHVWLSQNLNPGKTAAIMTMLEQVVETRSWREALGLTDDVSCRIYTQHSETVEHLVVGCTKLANIEYLTSHNRELIILPVAWAKQQELVGRTIKQSWCGTSRYTYEKPLLQEDQTWFWNWKLTRISGSVTWHAHNKITLGQKEQRSWRNTDNLR